MKINDDVIKVIIEQAKKDAPIERYGLPRPLQYDGDGVLPTLCLRQFAYQKRLRNSVCGGHAAHLYALWSVVRGANELCRVGTLHCGFHNHRGCVFKKNSAQNPANFCTALYFLYNNALHDHHFDGGESGYFAYI